MKLVITPDKIAAANAPQTRLRMDIDITGLSMSEIAEALCGLATRVEAEADLEKRVAALRAAVEATDSTLVTETRLPITHPDAFAVEHADRELGLATISTFTPNSTAVSDDDDEDADEDYEDHYEEDEEVEFYRGSEWHVGIVLDRIGLDAYLIEDKYGRRWEVSTRGLRVSDGDW